MTTELDRSTNETGEFDAAALVQALDVEPGTFPETALRNCQRHYEQVVPHLIPVIERATERILAGEEFDEMAHEFALYLLWEFQAKEALPAILEAISVPEEGPFEMFGDTITEDLPAILACLAGDRLDVVENLIANPDLNPYVRASASTSYHYLVRDEKLSREEAVARLRDHLRSAIDEEDAEFLTLLVPVLCDLNPQEAHLEIQKAFDKELVEEDLIDRAEAEELIAAGEQGYQEALAYVKPTHLADTVEHMRDWPCFDPAYERTEDGYYQLKGAAAGTPIFGDDLYPFGGTSAEDYGPLEDYDDEPPYLNTTTIRNEAPRIGRNDPCPCGSGKKYKKCCMREQPL